jgi:hypothetical protein
MISQHPVSARERSDDAARRVNVINQCAIDLDRIGATATADRAHVPIDGIAAADRRPDTETIGTLVSTKRLTLRQGTKIRSAHIIQSGHHIVIGPDEVLGLAPAGRRRIDRAIFARVHPNARLTQPGDVLITTVPRPAAMIDWDGYAIAETPVRILRIPLAQTEQFTPRVLAALLFATGAGTRPSGAVRASLALEDHRVPLLAPREVRRLDVTLARIETRHAVAQREIDVLDKLKHTAVGGLIDGTLAIASDEE